MLAISRHSALRNTGLILGLAAVYYVAGRLGLLLAIPPGYATAIWPPSGLALAAVLMFGFGCLPGVWLGSFILNFHPEAANVGVSLLSAAAIAAASMVQVAAGAWLVRCYVSLPTTLEKASDILGVGILGGPVACLIAATIGVTTLALQGVIPWNNYGFTWFTWWVGDSIGVLVFAPLALLLFQGRAVGIGARRKALITFPIVLLFALTVYAFFTVGTWENEKKQLSFESRAESALAVLQGNLKDYNDNLFAIERFYEFSNFVSRDEFGGFTRYSFERFPGIFALGWVPHVTDSRKQDFINQVRKDGPSDYRIKERNAEGAMVPANRRSDYFPTLYIEPYNADNQKALGFDLSSNAERKEAMMRAARSGEAAVTARITLVQDHQERAAFLLIKPIYNGGNIYTTPEDRLSHLKGFATEAFHIDTILQPVLQMFDSSDINVSLVDLSAAKQQTLYGSADQIMEPGQPNAWDKNFEFGGRVWSLRIVQTPAYIQTHKTWESWFILAGGLGLTGVMGLLFLLVTGQTDAVSRLVSEKTEELKSSEETFRQAIEYASIGMAFVSPTGRWLRVNNALCNLVGYSADELLSINFKTITHPDDLESNIKFVQQMLAHEIQSYQMEKRYFHKDGRTIWVLLNVSMITHDDGSPKYFIAQIQDISARKEIDRVKNEFISTVSHELRTPLTSIRGSLGLIVGGAMGALPDKALHLVDIAHKNSERLIHLVNDILDIEKIEAGKLDMQVKPIEVRGFLQQLVEMNKAYAEKYGVRFSIDEFDRNYTVLADAGRLMQVMANLMSNAAKFSPAGSEIILRVEARSHQKLRFLVIDQGEGISEEFRPRIFEKFVQADNSSTRRFEGAGLGLSISRKLVEAMNGSINFVSEVGKGSTFYIDMPVIQEQGKTAAVIEKKPERVIIEALPPSILHIEDDGDLASIMTGVVGKRAHMTTAPSLKQAEDFLASRRFDLIILDLALPDGSGVDFLQRLPSLVNYNIPVLILSASEATAEVKSSVAASLVKSRLSEERIVETIFSVITQASQNYQGTA